MAHLPYSIRKPTVHVGDRVAIGDETGMVTSIQLLYVVTVDYGHGDPQPVHPDQLQIVEQTSVGRDLDFGLGDEVEVTGAATNGIVIAMHLVEGTVNADVVHDQAGRMVYQTRFVKRARAASTPRRSRRAQVSKEQ